MGKQSGILSVYGFGLNLRVVWKAISAMNDRLKGMKHTVRSVRQEKREVYTKDMKRKIGILRARIRYFEKSEVKHILGPCTREIWEAVRNPKTGKHTLRSLRV